MQTIIVMYKPIDSTEKMDLLAYSPRQKLLGRLYELTAVRFYVQQIEDGFPFCKITPPPPPGPTYLGIYNRTIQN